MELLDLKDFGRDKKKVSVYAEKVAEKVVVTIRIAPIRVLFLLHFEIK